MLHRLLLITLLTQSADSLAQVIKTSEIHDTGLLQLEVYDIGKIGSYGGCDIPPSCGVGLVYAGDEGLYEGALLIGLDTARVSGGVYDIPVFSSKIPEWASVSVTSPLHPPVGFNQA